MELKLRRMDIIYRLFFSEDAKLRKLMLDLKTLVKKVGIEIHKLEEQTDLAH